MTKQSSFRVVAIVTALAATLPLAASEQEQGDGLVITERMQLTSFNPATGEGTQNGTFVVAGSVNESGVATATFRLTAGPNGCSRLTGPHTFIGSMGTITVLTKGLLCPSSAPNPPRSFARGTWRVIGSSGAYLGLHGRGKVLATADFTTGEITIARHGEIERDE